MATRKTKFGSGKTTIKKMADGGEPDFYAMTPEQRKAYSAENKARVKAKWDAINAENKIKGEAYEKEIKERTAQRQAEREARNKAKQDERKAQQEERLKKIAELKAAGRYEVVPEQYQLMASYAPKAYSQMRAAQNQMKDAYSNSMFGRKTTPIDPAVQAKIDDYNARRAAKQAAFAQTDAGKAQAAAKEAARAQERAQNVANAKAMSEKWLSEPDRSSSEFDPKAFDAITASIPKPANTFNFDTPSYGMKKGGAVKAKSKMKSGVSKLSSASKRGDGIAQRGKTKGRMV